MLWGYLPEDYIVSLDEVELYRCCIGKINKGAPIGVYIALHGKTVPVFGASDLKHFDPRTLFSDGCCTDGNGDFFCFRSKRFFFGKAGSRRCPDCRKKLKKLPNFPWENYASWSVPVDL